MKIILFISLLSLVIINEIFSQANCSNPLQVSVCPDTLLLNQTNAGMGDDAPAGINYTGEDLVYKITFPLTTIKIFISIANATGLIRSRLVKDSCTSITGPGFPFNTGTNSYTFSVSNSTTYFLWLDAATTVTFDIGIGADTSSTVVSHPDTQGNWTPDQSGCYAPVFHPAKPFYQVKFNNVFQTDPMTLAPLNVAGLFCINTILKNTTGDEGVRKFEFSFGSGYINIQAPDSIAGTYNTGYWVKSGTGNLIKYTFYEAASGGRGDFDGSPNTCLSYEFCFTLIPISNSPAITEVNVQLESDGYGAAYSGILNSGCCPAYFPNCHFNLGGSSSGVNGFGFGVNDPGGSLPVELINFDVTSAEGLVQIIWTTASEINNDYFTIERSEDALNWKELTMIDGNGNSTQTLNYKFTDEHPLPGLSYYRLKQTDFDGKISIYLPKSIHTDSENDFIIYPNPAKEKLIIDNFRESEFEADLFSSLGIRIDLPVLKTQKEKIFNTSILNPGIYFLVIRSENEILKKEIIMITK